MKEIENFLIRLIQNREDDIVDFAADRLATKLKYHITKDMIAERLKEQVVGELKSFNIKKMTFQKTNQWGVPTGSPMCLPDFIVGMIKDQLQKRVEKEGKNMTFIESLVIKEIKKEIEKTIGGFLKSTKAQIRTGMNKVLEEILQKEK